MGFTCALCVLNLLREDRRLAPADHMLWWKAILMHDPEVVFRSANHFRWWMALEPEEYLEENAGDSGMHWEVQ